MPDKPIIDNTHLPLSAWQRLSGPTGGTCRWLWYKMLRPLLLTLLWCAFLSLVAWDFHLSFTTSAETLRFLRWCGGGILILMSIMLIKARRTPAHSQDTAHPKPGQALATLVNVPTRTLRAWQRARCLRAQHDTHGELRGVAVTPLRSAPRSGKPY